MSTGEKNLSSDLTLASTDTLNNGDFSINSVGYDPNISISDYLSREVPIYSSAFTGDITSETLYPLNLFLSLPSTIPKISHFHLLSGTLNIRLLITSDPYACGQILLSSKYGAVANTSLPTLNSTLITVHRFTCNHVICDVGTTNQAMMSIPILVRDPQLSISEILKPYWNDITISLDSLTTVKSVQDNSNSNISVRIFASITNAQVKIPVISQTIYTMESTLASQGPISYPASIVSSVTRSLSKVPIIGKFAYATSIVAGAIGDLAILLGFSRPRDFSDRSYPHCEDIATYAGNSRAKPLTLDPHQEIPLSAQYTGSTKDVLSYSETVGREGIVCFGNISQSEDPGDQNAIIPVTPSFAYAGENTGYLDFAMSPLSYCSMTHSLWRGSLIYKFVFPANKFLRGKFRIVWTPTRITSTDYALISRNAVSVLVDLSTSAEVELVVPWGIAKSYLPVVKPRYYNDYFGYDEVNGYVAMYIEQPLQAPSSTFSLEFYVTVRAGDDFELQIPRSELINRLHRRFAVTSPAVTILPKILTAETPGFSVNSAYNISPTYSTYTMESNEITPVLSSTTTFLQTADATEVATHFMGERFTSFRPMIKKASIYTNYMTSTTRAFTKYIMYNLPYFPDEVNTVAFSPTQTVIPPVVTTPIRYMSNLFVGVRGSVRYTLVPEPEYNSGELCCSLTVSNCFLTPYSEDSFNMQVTSPYNLVLEGRDKMTGFHMRAGEPICFDVPHQFVHQYYPTDVIENYNRECYGFSLGTWGALRSLIYVSAGEDFTPVIWNGVPVMEYY